MAVADALAGDKGGVADAVKGGGPTDSLMRQREGLVSDLAKPSPVTQKAKELDTTLDVISEERKNAAKDTGALVPPTLTEPPTYKPTDLTTMFGSPAMWMATFGSFLTRNPIKTSLNAAAGVMNAYHKRDFQQAQRD